jgi:transketolase
MSTITESTPKFELKMGAATRDAYGKALADLGRRNPNIVVLDADLAKSTKTAVFAKEFPDRFFTCGIAEADMVGIAGGLAAAGKIPFASSFSAFLLCKGFDQLRVAVALPHVNAKFVGSHGGISIGEDGPSQMSVEDYALACGLAGFTVVSPADEISTRALVFRAAEHVGPVYMRVGRPKTPLVYAADDDDFALGKARVLREGSDLAFIGCGLMVAECLRAAHELTAEGVNAMVVDMHTLKPLDREVVAAACRTGAIVTAEEHLLDGGLGSQVARAAAGIAPVPMEFVGIENTYAESATPEQLLEKYGLTATNIVAAARRAIKRKRN